MLSEMCDDVRSFLPQCKVSGLCGEMCWSLSTMPCFIILPQGVVWPSRGLDEGGRRWGVGVGVGQWKRERKSALRRGVRLEIKWLALNVTITLYFSLLTSQADGCQEGDRGELMGRKNTAVWFVALEWRCLLGKSLELVKYVSKHLVLLKV